MKKGILFLLLASLMGATSISMAASEHQDAAVSQEDLLTLPGSDDLANDFLPNIALDFRVDPVHAAAAGYLSDIENFRKKENAEEEKDTLFLKKGKDLFLKPVERILGAATKIPGKAVGLVFRLGEDGSEQPGNLAEKNQLGILSPHRVFAPLKANIIPLFDGRYLVARSLAKEWSNQKTLNSYLPEDDASRGTPLLKIHILFEDFRVKSDQ